MLIVGDGETVGMGNIGEKVGAPEIQLKQYTFSDTFSAGLTWVASKQVGSDRVPNQLPVQEFPDQMEIDGRSVVPTKQFK